MLGGENTTLLEIEELLRHMKVDEVESKLAKIEKKNDITEKESLRVKLLKIKFLFDTDKWEEGSDILEKILPECEKAENKLIWLDALLLKSIYYTELGFHDEGIKNSERGLDVIKKLKTSDNVFILREAWFLLYKGFNHNIKGNHNLAEEIIERCFELASKLNDAYLLYTSYRFKMGPLWIKGKNQQIFELYLKIYELAKEIKNDYLIAWSCINGAVMAHWADRYDVLKKLMDEAEEVIKKQKKLSTPYEFLENQKASLHYTLGEMSKAISIWKRVNPRLRKKIVDPERMGIILTSESIIERFEGNIDRAIELRQQIISMFTKIGNEYRIYQHKILLARCLLVAGQYTHALRICQEIMENYSYITNELMNRLIFFIMGKIYQIQGEYYLSLDYFRKSLTLGKKIPGIKIYDIQSLFHLILLLVEKNQEEMSYQYLGELQEIIDKNPSELNTKYYQAARAIILKASSRPKNWIQALNILEEVVEEIWEGKIIDQELIIVALINLCELLMNEFSISGEREVMDELEKYTNKLEEIASKQKSLSYILRLEVKNIRLHTIWLKTIYSLADVDLKKAKALIDEARDMADEEGLVLLAEKINRQQSKLYNQLFQWNEFIQKQDII
jgi:tetratricopeptide (TPR) repeat protein